MEDLRSILQVAQAFRSGDAWHRALEFEAKMSNGQEWYYSNPLSKRVAEDYTRPSARVVACADDACADAYHSYDSTTVLGAPEMVHHGESIGDARGQYRVAMKRETAAEWTLDIEVDDDLTPFSARSLANDINWLSAECDRLNRSSLVGAA